MDEAREARKRWGADAEAENARRKAAAQEFLEQLNARFKGKEFAGLKLAEDSLEPVIRVGFTDGSYLPIEFELNDCEGGFCVATMTIGEVSLHTFMSVAE